MKVLTLKGRLFQVEYAQKAVKNSGTAIGICCVDGVVFGVENLRASKLLEKDSNSKIFTVDKHIGMTSAGWEPDGLCVSRKGKEESKSYKNFYGSNIPTKILCDRVSSFVHMYTCYWHLRPFGCSVILGGVTNDGPELFTITPSGESWGYHASAIGKGVQQAKSELEKLKLKEIKCAQAVKEIARIIWKCHDFVKDKEFELELSWVCKDSKNLHVDVPEKLKNDAIEYAKKKKKEEEEDSSDEEDEGEDDDGDVKMKDDKK